MSNDFERDAAMQSPFFGLVPSRLRAEAAAAPLIEPRQQSRLAKGVHSTVPVLLVGSLAVATMNLSGQVEPTTPKRSHEPKSETADLGNTVRNAVASANATISPATPLPPEEAEISAAGAPSAYRVKGGDTVSGIAGRYGLSTASVLAMNGLGWKSTIYPGQVLKLTKSSPAKHSPVKSTPRTSTPSHGSNSTSRYTVRKGDSVSGIAHRFGVTTQAVLSANGLSMSSTIYAGRTIVIPGKHSTGGGHSPSRPSPVVAPRGGVSAHGTTYKIKSGDTLSGISHKFGVSVQSIIAANGMSSSSIIYAGRVLKIPGLQSASVGAQVAYLSPGMATNAATIVRVGRSLGVSNYGIVVALAAAMQESGLRNIDYGDRDSIGLFQQRPSAGWGSKAKLLNPEHAARLFFGGRSNPNRGVTRGLLDIPGWQAMPLTKVAQAVQISAFPNAYAKWEVSARSWLSRLT